MRIFKFPSFSLLWLLALEILLRAFVVNPGDLDTWSYSHTGLGDLPPNRNFIASENPFLPYRVVTNSLGLRNSEDVSLVKPAGKIRILTIGDSFTFGPYVNNQDTYPSKLEQILKQKYPEVEVLNAGIPGYTLKDELEYLEEKGVKLNPDVIVVGVYIADLSRYGASSQAIFSRAQHQRTEARWGWLLKLARKSAILAEVRQLAKNWTLPKVQKDIKPTTAPDQSDLQFLPAYLEDLKGLLKLADDQHIKLLYLFLPAYIQEVENSTYFPQVKIIEKFPADRPKLDLLPIFQANPYPKSLYLMPLNSHLSAFGNEIVASAAAEKIKEILSQNPESN